MTTKTAIKNMNKDAHSYMMLENQLEELVGRKSYMGFSTQNDALN